MTNEQIQALRAAIDDATQGSWVNESGEGWEAICCDDDQGNAGFIIAEFQGRDAADNRKFVQCANPNTILSLLTERDADKALIAEQAKRIEFLKEQLAQLANFNPDWDKLEAATDSLREHMAELTEANKRIAELEGALNLASASYAGERERADALQARMRTVKFPEDWHFEECETEGCQNGALFSVGKAAKNLHLCEVCAKEPANSRLSKTALPKRLPFRIAAGITLDVGE
ncbi:ead/Ea22-like family protein [Phytobacter sp. MRY16-398]|uniref:ead/Ea22-like family protein n=1 Tax=Phytobacter sp. MRY16-398 TaxID=2487150 RepID=UPI000DF62881|nr:ead/Ea22-like family protein [Phytobacter sp. MRY16-398]BBE76230.1 hypothetical protein MRY16398_12860 [Phytobacter sp. MRY16-398]